MFKCLDIRPLPSYQPPPTHTHTIARNSNLFLSLSLSLSLPPSLPHTLAGSSQPTVTSHLTSFNICSSASMTNPSFFFSQVQLQNMMTSKYIAHFLTEVSAWQKKLSTADQVISIYMEVQRTWSHLESIFIGSEDIRNQLPEDSKRFDGIDTDFKVGLLHTRKVIGSNRLYWVLLLA